MIVFFYLFSWASAFSADVVALETRSSEDVYKMAE